VCYRAKITVFIVDGSSIIQERLTTMLADLNNVEVIGQAQNAADAVRSIRACKPDLVIQDVHTADGSGLDLLAAVKQDEGSPIVIVLTNNAYPAYRKAYQRAGADFFFDKSSEFDQIPEVLRRLVNGHLPLERGEQ